MVSPYNNKLSELVEGNPEGDDFFAKCTIGVDPGFVAPTKRTGTELIFCTTNKFDPAKEITTNDT